jgi:retron-type reverse transcriptase
MAWKRVKSNKGSGGVDKITIEKFNDNESEYLGKLHEEVKERSYEVTPVRRVYIDKPGKKEKRPLGIPTIRVTVIFDFSAFTEFF